jgi:hypothetical protein
VDAFGEIAILQLFAIGAGFEAFRFHTIPDFAFGTMRKFHSGFAATGAINHFVCDVCTKLAFPFFGGLGTQFVVIGYNRQSVFPWCCFLKVIVEIPVEYQN